MTDPRNIAHDKKVQQEKKHHHEEAVAGAAETPQPGRKPHLRDDAKADDATPANDAPASNA